MTLRAFSLSTLAPLALLTLAGCDSATSGANSGITEAAVDAITEGDSVGVQFTGKWTLQTTVTESSCGGLVGLPEQGDTDEETLPLVHNQGALDPGVNDLGDLWRFNGGIDNDGAFEWGTVWSFELGGADVKRVELATGRMTLPEEGLAATLTGTSRRRYTVQSLLIDCTATFSMTGTRTGLDGGSEM
jgi:hypothetical protein